MKLLEDRLLAATCWLLAGNMLVAGNNLWVAGPQPEVAGRNMRLLARNLWKLLTDHALLASKRSHTTWADRGSYYSDREVADPQPDAENCISRFSHPLFKGRHPFRP